jgi:hypothetical protein
LNSIYDCQLATCPAFTTACIQFRSNSGLTDTANSSTPLSKSIRRCSANRESHLHRHTTLHSPLHQLFNDINNRVGLHHPSPPPLPLRHPSPTHTPHPASSPHTPATSSAKLESLPTSNSRRRVIPLPPSAPIRFAYFPPFFLLTSRAFQAYCSIRLTSMAATFGVSPQFLDRFVAP